MRKPNETPNSSSTNDLRAPQDPNENSPRRRFLQSTVATAAFGLAANLGFNIASTKRANAQSAMTPDAALAELKAGNTRFLSRKLTAHGSLVSQSLALDASHRTEYEGRLRFISSCLYSSRFFTCSSSLGIQMRFARSSLSRGPPPMCCAARTGARRWCTSAYPR